LTNHQYYSNINPVNVKSMTRKLAADGPPKDLRAQHGLWVKPAAVVYALVHKQPKGKAWNVSDAVRRVISQGDYGDPRRAFNGIRAAYYIMRKHRLEDFAL